MIVQPFDKFNCDKPSQDAKWLREGFFVASKEIDNLVKIEAIIRPNVLDAVKACLDEIGVTGLTVHEVRGAGKQKGYTQHYRGAEYSVNLLPKIKLEVVVPDAAEKEVIDTIIASAKTGEIGDGKIFVTKIESAIRIRTLERDDDAL